MAEPSTVIILRNKCVEIELRIAAYQREIEIPHKNLVAVQMTLAVFRCENGAPYHSQTSGTKSAKTPIIFSINVTDSYRESCVAGNIRTFFLIARLRQFGVSPFPYGRTYV